MSRRRSNSFWSNPLQRAIGTTTRKLLRASLKASTKATTKALKKTSKTVTKSITRTMTRTLTDAVSQSMKPALKAATAFKPSAPPKGPGEWIKGVAVGAGGARNFRIYKPPGVAAGERLPLLVMLHGCGQDANGFAVSTRMNAVAARERFIVLYPEQDKLSNHQGCWNWFETRSGRAFGEASILLAAIDQACLLYPVDTARVAIAGLSAGASMAALLVSRHPGRFKAVIMHSGVPPGAAHSTLSALSAMRGHRSVSPAAALIDSGLPATEWPALLVIQGRSDSVVAPRNGRAAAQYWAEHTQAREGAPRAVKRGGRYGTSVTDFKRRSRTMVTLYEVDSLGHAWSGGNSRLPFGDAKGPDASRMTWAFTLRQFKLAAKVST